MVHEGDDKEGKEDGLTSSYYHGEFVNGRRHGKGTYVDLVGLSTYTGDWADDLPHGFCSITWGNGSQFEGKIVKGRLSQGKYTFGSGALYIGKFDEVKGNFAGKGQYFNENEIIEGTWIDGVLNGYATCKFKDGSSMQG